jgi:hypothetical protein
MPATSPDVPTGPAWRSWKLSRRKLPGCHARVFAAVLEIADADTDLEWNAGWAALDNAYRARGWGDTLPQRQPGRRPAASKGSP